HYIYDYEEKRTTSVQYGQVVLREDLIGNTWEEEGDEAKYPQLTWDSQYPWGWDVDAENPEWDGDPDHPLAKGYWLDGTETDQTYGYNNESAFYSKYLYKGDYARLQNVEIGYSFSDELSGKIIGLNSLRVYGSATNLFLWTREYNGWDPETGGGVLPPLKVFNLGITANF
ncbi:MAG: hypothetical protein ACOCXO_03720, partial [Bacteroidota bacterium]